MKYTQMIEITSKVAINEADLHFEFVQAGGPGGQNVNKVASAVQLRYNVHQADLPPQVKERLTKLAGNRITTDGTLIINARRHRQQERNRQDALDRLVSLLVQATKAPRLRKATKPKRAAKARRLEKKRRRSQTKHLRRSIKTFDEA